MHKHSRFAQTCVICILLQPCISLQLFLATAILKVQHIIDEIGLLFGIFFHNQFDLS